MEVLQLHFMRRIVKKRLGLKMTINMLLKMLFINEYPITIMNMTHKKEFFSSPSLFLKVIKSSGLKHKFKINHKMMIITNFMKQLIENQYLKGIAQYFLFSSTTLAFTN